jgi:hypothetical protein
VIARVKRMRRGGFALRIPPPERELLSAVPAMLRSLLEADEREDVAMRRLFPSAYLDDRAAADEFDASVRDDLLEERRSAIDTMERTLRADRLSEEELTAWLGAVNDVRLVLGVRLAVTEESGPDDFEADPDAARAYGLYLYLSSLEEEVVHALSSR